MGSIPTETPKFDKHVDYNNLPCPVPFEEIHREALMSLKPDSFGGGRFEYIKALGPNFFLSDSVTMGPMEVPSQSPETLKIPASNYEFGANYIDPKISSEPNMSHVMSSIDYTGTDYRTQFQFGSGALLSANSIQVATGQVTSTGMVALGYFQKVSEKLSFTTDFMYTLLSRDATASVGYGAALRQARVRGKIDSNGVATAHVDKRLNPGLGFSLSVEARFNVLLDHGKKDYKFGFGLNAGD